MGAIGGRRDGYGDVTVTDGGAVITLRMTKRQHERLKSEAHAKEESLNEYAVRTLIRSLEEDDDKPELGRCVECGREIALAKKRRSERVSPSEKRRGLAKDSGVTYVCILGHRNDKCES